MYLDESPDPPWERVILNSLGKAAHCKVLGFYVVTCAKTAEPVEMPFRFWAWMGPRNHVLDVGPDPLWEGVILRGTCCKV